MEHQLRFLVNKLVALVNVDSKDKSFPPPLHPTEYNGCIVYSDSSDWNMFSICRKLYFPHWQLLQSHNWLCTLVSYITHITLLQHVSPQIQGQDTELCRSCNGRCCRTFSRGWTLARSSSGTAATATLSRRGDTSRWLQNLLFFSWIHLRWCFDS